MEKTFKRILAVLLLIVFVAVVGYAVFTANRLPSLQQEQISTNEEALLWISAEYLT